MKDVIIIGAGAAGLMAAQRAASLGAKVTIYEALDAPGRKLSATGNGRCNYTNIFMSPKDYHLTADADIISRRFFQGEDADISDDAISGDAQLRNAFYSCFDRFDNEDAIEFFCGIGIEPHIRDGYVYPRSGEASSVVRALVRSCERLGVNIKKNHRIESIHELEPDKPGAERSLILACGSRASVKGCNSYRLLEELGVGYSWISPALCGIYCTGDEEFFKAAAGVRCSGSINGEFGELQFTEYGISGIAAFNISHDIGRRLHGQNGRGGMDVCRQDTDICRDKPGCGACASEKPVLTVDFLPEYEDEDDVLIFLDERMKKICTDDNGWIQQLKELGDGFINLKLWYALVERTAEQHGGRVTLLDLARSLKCSVFIPYKTAGFDKCQVCAGGIGTDEIDPDTMQLRRHPGIYAAGEIIDMDGICGGYNLQWAWTSGYIAGTYAAGGRLSS